MARLQLLTDQALGEAGFEGTDGLGFDSYAQILSNAALSTPGPFTVGIFGEWGTGKTSLMKMISDTLSKEPETITVWFNAWRFEKEEHPIVPLVASIVKELERNKTFLRQLGDAGSNLVRSLRAVAYGFSAKSTVKLPGFAEIEASFVAKDMIDRVDNLRPDALLDRSLYYEAFETLASVHLEKRARIVILVDDLDRRFPDLAIKLLESIKLVLSQPGFVFVLGVARTIIEGYLNSRYKDKYGLKEFDGASYLDKIVQLPFHIPPHRGRMEAFLANLLSQLDPDVQCVFDNLKHIIGSASGANPRATKRFVNNLLIDRAINENLSRVEIPEHARMEVIPIAYFAVTRSLQQRWKEVFSQLAASPELCTQISEWDGESLIEHANSEDHDVSAVATTLLGDKAIAELLFSSEGRAWLKDEDQRISTIEFLKEKRVEATGQMIQPADEFDVFISYHHHDREPVARIANFLADRGIKFFIDREQIEAGDLWAEKVDQAMAKSRAFIVCVGRGLEAPGWQASEMDTALRQSGKDRDLKIIPILLPGADPERLPLFLKTRQWLDLRDTKITDDTLRPLARALQYKT